MSEEKQIEEMAGDIAKATRFASQRLVEETKAFVKENHRYHSKNDFNKAHKKTISELEAEYLNAKGYRKQSEGEWGFDGISWTCSECGEYATKGIKTNFCPNCGAKMKGGEYMDEYINREDALKIIDSYSKACTEEGKIVADAIRDIIAVITPTADVAPKSEVARNIFGNLKILGHIDFDGNFCIRKDAFEKLKKKYTEEGK